VPSKQQQADSEIHEDQLLNFLVNALDEEVGLTLANNADIDAEDLYEVLVGASADGTSISTLCNSSEDSPPATTVLYHLRSGYTVASAADRRRQRQLRLRSMLLNHSRRHITTEERAQIRLTGHTL